MCVNMKSQDILSAQSLRTFRSEAFCGHLLLQRLETLSRAKRRGAAPCIKVIRIPVNPKASVNRFEDPIPFAECYGYRGNAMQVFYLSPWAFTIQWCIEKLHPPPHYEQMYMTHLTRWTARGQHLYETRTSDAVEMEPGIDYVLVEESLERGTIAYPDIPVLERFRHAWYMRPHVRPMVPQPMHTPLPDKRLTKDRRALEYFWGARLGIPG